MSQPVVAGFAVRNSNLVSSGTAGESLASQPVVALVAGIACLTSFCRVFGHFVAALIFLVCPLGGFCLKARVLAGGRDRSPSKINAPKGTLAAAFLSCICFMSCLQTPSGLVICGAVI